ncbi:hypothetical protein DFH29DRAFT_464888 [Suillus ampliporus]|nr:hypothetical protein DFH29DRAFT_464888 [Suillus ampliporus]
MRPLECLVLCCAHACCALLFCFLGERHEERAIACGGICRRCTLLICCGSRRRMVRMRTGERFVYRWFRRGRFVGKGTGGEEGILLWQGLGYVLTKLLHPVTFVLVAISVHVRCIREGHELPYGEFIREGLETFNRRRGDQVWCLLPPSRPGKMISVCSTSTGAT